MVVPSEQPTPSETGLYVAEAGVRNHGPLNSIPAFAGMPRWRSIVMLSQESLSWFLRRRFHVVYCCFCHILDLDSGWRTKLKLGVGNLDVKTVVGIGLFDHN